MPTFSFAGAGPAAALWGEAIRHAPGHRVLMVASRTTAGAMRVAAGLQVETCRYDDLPAGADIVVVASPPQLHVDHALAAVRGGAAAVVERPIATTLLDADRLVAAADAGARIAYAEPLLFSPLVREAIHRIRGLGRLTHLDARIHATAPRPPAEQATRGGGVLLEQGTQALAVILAAVGDDLPVAVTARFAEAPTSAPAVEDRAEVVLELRSGARAHLTVAWGSEQPAWDLQVATASSAFRLELLPHPHLEQLGVDLPLPATRFPAAPPQLEQYGYLDQVLEVADDLTIGPGAYLDSRFGRQVLDVVCAASRAAGTGTSEPLPFRGPRDRTPLELRAGT